MKSVFSKAEHKVLTQYKYGAVVLVQHQDILDRYAAIGFVATGFNWDTMEATARLTPLGLKHL